MLQWINDRLKVIGWIFILPLALVFAVWGVHGIVDFATSRDKGLRVNGEEVRVDRVRQDYQERLAELNRAYPDEIPAEARTSAQKSTIERFVNTALFDQQVAALGYTVSDRDVVQSIESIESFQVGGKFNLDSYHALLRAQGLTPSQFEADQRRSLRARALEGGLFLSSFVTPKELAEAAALRGETRELAYAVLPAARFAAGARPDASALTAYYERHKDAFKTPETVRLSYVALRVADAAREVTVDEPALRAYYDTVKERYIEAEKRHARHILIGAGSDAAVAEKKVAEVLALARRPGADFAALARQYSQDTGSAAQGGDLGWAEKSFFVGPFADALFAMQPGEIRGPVKTPFGWHIIRLEEVQPGKVKTFEQVHGDLEQEYRRVEAERRFGERQEKLDQLAFESSDSLEPVAHALGVKVEQIASFARGAAADPRAAELAASPKVLQAAFSADVLAGQNSRAIELAPGNVVVLRASEHKLPEQQPLEAVRAQVEQAVRRELAETEARTAAARVAAAVQGLAAGQSWEPVLKPIGSVVPVVIDKPAAPGAPPPKPTPAKPPAADALRLQAARFVGRQEAGVAPELLKQAFAAGQPAAGKPLVGSLRLGNGDYAVFAVTAVRPGVAAADAQNERRLLGNAAAQAEFGEYLARLRARADVHVNPTLFE